VARVAAVDIGTNSVLLLAVEQTAQGPAVLADRAVVTRLGEGVDRTRQLSAGGRRRTLECLAAYAGQLRELGVESLAVVGTSALRDTEDATGFCAEVRTLLGSEPRVLDGEEEARLSYEGALSGLALEGPIALCDPGGGSTELIYGSVTGDVSAIDALYSLELGGVRLHERYVRHDPPTPTELDELGQAVRTTLGMLPPPPGRVTWVSVGGTVTTLSAIELGLVRYQGARVHGTRLSATRIHDLAVRLARLPIEARRTLAGLDPARADVIVAGAFLLWELVNWARTSELVVSDRGVRWGLAQRLLGGRGLFPPSA
jgi:exopolyphosphatase/guanosine-5'-triphosphate,3'-diphosphate pyrophosphatase